MTTTNLKTTRNDRSPPIKELKKKHSPRMVEGVENVSQVERTHGKEATCRPDQVSAGRAGGPTFLSR